MSEVISLDSWFPVTLTENAIKQFLSVRNSDPDLNKTFSVRVACKGGGCSGLLYNLDFDDEPEEDDYKKTYVLDGDELNVVVDPLSAEYLKGLTVDYVTGLLESGFRFTGAEAAKRHCGCGKSFAI